MNKVEGHKYLGILACDTMKESSQNKKVIKTELVRNTRNSLRSKLIAENVSQDRVQGSLDGSKDK